MNRLVKMVFVLSVGINVLFFYRSFCGHPDIDFYSTSGKEAYFIKKHEAGDYFIIEHKDSPDGRLHRYTAKCKSTLTWLDGIVNPSRPMSDTCMYLPRLVGKTIAAGKMRKEGSTIVYMPWADDDTVQTADVLKIVNDEPVK